jgi:hypothetical protein
MHCLRSFLPQADCTIVLTKEIAALEDGDDIFVSFASQFLIHRAKRKFVKSET